MATGRPSLRLLPLKTVPLEVSESTCRSEYKSRNVTLRFGHESSSDDEPDPLIDLDGCI